MQALAFLTLVGFVAALALLTLPVWLGIVIIGERQVGVVIKKFSRQPLPAGRLIALNGEAGYQADTLAPGIHLGYWPWQYQVRKVPMTVVPQSEIALVVAADGAPIPPGRILGRVVDCDGFQDARKFLLNGGEKGRQIGILTAGTYRINTALFTVITSDSADDSVIRVESRAGDPGRLVKVANVGANENNMAPNELRVYRVEADKVGIVTTLDGTPIEEGEIAGPLIPAHDNFQDTQAFVDGGGRRGLQEQVLLSGSWNLNPWFAKIEQVPMTEIPIGYVGVVISFVGQAHVDVSGLEFKHGDLVDQGHKGVWVTPLYPGKHPINTRVMRVELVPTTNIVLNWAARTESHQYDAKLSSITVRSRDGFAFNLDVAQVIHVGALDAPRVISRVGSMQNLVDHVLQPIVGNYFRNSAQDYTVLDFLSARSERQTEAAEHIRTALHAYDVQAIDTLIGDINPPAQLMQTQIDRKIAEEERKTFEVQEAAQKQRQLLVRETAMAEIQNDMVRSEQNVRISELEANAQIRHATGEAESIRLRATGESEALRLRATAESEALKLRGAGEAEAIRATGIARADAYRVGVESLGSQAFSVLQMMQVIGERSVRIVPDVQVNGSEGGAGLVEALLGTLVHKPANGKGKSVDTN